MFDLVFYHPGKENPAAKWKPYCTEPSVYSTVLGKPRDNVKVFLPDPTSKIDAHQIRIVLRGKINYFLLFAQTQKNVENSYVMLPELACN